MRDSAPRGGTGPAFAITRRRLGEALAGAFAYAATGATPGAAEDGGVNAPRDYPVHDAASALDCVVDVTDDLGPIDHDIFGTNLEWFNEGGGFDSPDPRLRSRLVALAREEKLSVMRFPGGTLADYYHWRDGTGPRERRPTRHHPTDPGQSANGFGSPEFFRLLRDTGARGLITVNAGTSTPEEAARWVAYANQPGHEGRRADGFPAPIGIKLWEVGNELYLPGNPGELKITQTPEAYAEHFIAFADAIRHVDPNVTVIAIGVAKSRATPDTPFPDWTQKLLEAAAPKIDMIAVHNAYFPLLINVRQPKVERVYPALWAAPEAVDRSLKTLDALLSRYDEDRRIGIAITEWGALFSLPTVDPYWVDHVKTIGSGVYMARMLQVFLSNPRVRLANYFKFTDRSFMGWVNLEGQPKVPYWIFRLYAEATGDRRVAAMMDSPTYSVPPVAVMVPEEDVPEVTVVATKATSAGTLFVNFVNRSLDTSHRIKLRVANGAVAPTGEIRSVSAREPTAHNGNDIPPEWPMKPDYDPYTTAPPDSIRIESRPWQKDDMVVLPPFSVASLILKLEDARP